MHKEVRIIRGKPWYVRFLLRVLFKPEHPQDVVVAFGRRIWADKAFFQPLAEHEYVHLHQHGFSYWGAIRWWVRYLRDKEFRYRQELEAYRVEYQAFRRMMRDGNTQREYAHRLATHLSGALYGNLREYTTALREITEYWHYDAPNPSIARNLARP